MPTLVRILKNAWMTGLLLLSLGAWAADSAQLPQVVVMRPDASVREYLEKNNQVLMDLSESPELGRFADRMGEMLQTRLVRPDDGFKKIHFVLIESAEANAFSGRLPNGDGCIMVNRGMLQFLQNDDELAFLLGHELEHGVSELQSEVTRVHAAGDPALSTVLQRSVETEADVKSLMRRVVEGGFNPYAAIHFIEREQARRGGLLDYMGFGHPVVSARRDSFALAITGLKRQGGKQIKQDAPAEYSRTVVGPLQDRYLNTSEYLQKQTQKMKSVIHRPDPVPAQLYLAALEGQRPSQGYDEVFARRWEEVAAELPDVWDVRARIDRQLELHQELQAQFDRARAAALADLSEHTSTASLVDLERLDHRHYALEAPSVSTAKHGVTHAQTQLQEVDRELASEVLSEKRREELVSLKKAKQQILTQKQAEYELSLYPYGERAALERLTESGGDLQEYLRDIGGFSAQNLKNRQELVRGHLQKILAVDQDWDSLLRRLSLLEALPVAEQAALTPQVFKVIRQVADTLPEDSFIRQWKNSDILKGLLTRSFSVDPKGAVQAFRPVFAKMLEVKDPLDWVESGFPSLGAPLEARSQSDKIVFNREFLNQLMDSETAALFAKNAGESVRRELSASNAVVSDYLLASFKKKNGTLNSLIEKGFLTSQQGRAIGLPEQLSDFLKKQKWGGEGLKPEQARSLFFVHEPEIYDTLPESGKPTEIEIRRNVLEAASVKGASSRRLDYRKLKRFAGSTEREYFELLTSVADLVDFGSGFQLEHSEQMARTEFLGSYAQWLRQNRPERTELRGIITAPQKSSILFSTDGKRLIDLHQSEGAQFLEERFAHYMSKYAALSSRQQAEETAFQLMRELKSWPEGIETVSQRWLSSDPAQAAEFYLGFMAGVRRAHPFDANFRIENFISWRKTLPWVPTLSQKNPALLGELYLAIRNVSGSLSRAETDQVFEAFWTATEGRPELRRRFVGAEMVSLLHFDQNKVKLARWQLEQKFKISAFAKAYRADRRALPSGKKVRPLVKQVRKFLDQQFDHATGTKSEIVGWVEDSLLTNIEETRFLDDRKLGVHNWYQNRAVAAVDLPHILAQRLPSQSDRRMLLEYLIGASNEMPRFVRELQSPGARNEEEKLLLQAKRHFQEGDIRLRTYLLQPLLDAKNGVLSDPVETERVYSLILGNQAQDPLFRKVFLTYLDALPESDRKVVLGQILAKLADRPGGKTSLKTLLEAMGPMGIRAGQFIRASGLASAELLTDLDDFFDQAMVPERTVVFNQLEKIFGTELEKQTVRQVVGAGSINYVVLADLKNPKTGKTERAVVRILRNSVEGQLANENAVWEAVIEKLKVDPSPKVKKFGEFMAEVREHAYSTLKQGGLELDQSLERASYGSAQRVYERPRHAGRRFEVHVARPLDEIQKLIPESLQKQVSVYEFIPHQRLVEIPSAEVRRDAARVIVESELQAIFEKGTFDPDGHPGNWLIDAEHGRLTRIDYAQLRSIPADELDAFKKTVRMLIEEKPSAKTMKAVIPYLSGVMDLDRLSSEEISKIVSLAVKDPRFPSSSRPEERLFFLRNRLDEKAVQLGFKGVRIRENARAALAALSKVMIYRKDVGSLDFNLKLANSLDAFEKRPLLRMAVGVMQRCRPGSVLKNALEKLLNKP